MTLGRAFVDWDRLRVFRTVVDAGSFTAAARKLQLSQSAVSRQVCSLEESLKLPLFYRHARGLRLTEHGDMFDETVRAMEGQLAKVLNRIADARAHAEGPLRITTTVAFGSAWLSPRIARFHHLYPDITISVLLVDSPELDLLSRQADVAIRFENQTRGELIEKRLMSLRYHLYASTTYIRDHGIPNSFSDLDHHKLIVYGGGYESPLKNFDWILQAGREAGNPRRPALRVNNVYGMFRAVRSGLGIAALPHYIADEAPDLQEVLGHEPAPSFDAYLVYAEDMRGSRRIQALRDFLMHEVLEEASSATAGSSLEACKMCHQTHGADEVCAPVSKEASLGSAPAPSENPSER